MWAWSISIWGSVTYLVSCGSLKISEGVSLSSFTSCSLQFSPITKHSVAFEASCSFWRLFEVLSRQRFPGGQRPRCGLYLHSLPWWLVYGVRCRWWVPPSNSVTLDHCRLIACPKNLLTLLPAFAHSFVCHFLFQNTACIVVASRHASSSVVSICCATCLHLLYVWPLRTVSFILLSFLSFSYLVASTFICIVMYLSSMVFKVSSSYFTLTWMGLVFRKCHFFLSLWFSVDYVSL